MDDTSRLSRLLAYLEHDPDNLALLSDAANAALDESALDHADALVKRYAGLAGLPPSLTNTAGIVAMRRGDREGARVAFEALRGAGFDNPPVRFNLAWLAALDGRNDEVLELLDDEVIATVPRASALKVQALHHLGEVDEAVAQGRVLLEHLPDDDALLGAVAVAAMDADDYALSAQLAGRARGGVDALTTQGLVALNENAPDAALALFERALAEDPVAPRAWLGRGLGLLAQGDSAAAAAALEKGAGIWGDHLGSWIAAGWARFVDGDLAGARRNFETALAHDDNFAESHGALAVLDLAAGDLASAQRRAEIALRLDKESFGGMLARAMLFEAKGQPDLAKRVIERAMILPAGVGGQTLAQVLTGLGTAPAARTPRR